jgi:TPR repeat protein
MTPCQKEENDMHHSYFRRLLFKPIMILITLAILISACNTETPLLKERDVITSGDANGFLIVDCLLPGQVRKLGREFTTLTARRPIKTPAANCEYRGGEYVAYDRANYATALKVWLAAAEEGDPKAQTYVGEAYQKGLGIPPNYEKAAEWYKKAAAQGYASAQMNLGFLYEKGLGVKQDSAMAAKLYHQAAGLPDISTTPNSIASLREQLRQTQEQLRKAQAELEAERARIAMLERENQQQHSELKAEAEKAKAHLAELKEEVARLRLDREKTEKKLTKKQKDCRASVLRYDECEESQEEGTKELPLGNYHALIIGNNKYQYWPKLITAVNDAKAVDELLRQRYGYKTTVLLNATRYQILETLNELRKRLTEKDNLLIYYAGHGEFDKVNQRGQWVPVDASEESTTNWIPNIQITDILNTMSSKHILVVADSCYSGAMTRSSFTRLAAGMTPEKRFKWIKTMLERKSRTALSSGGIKPVLDSGGGGHSMFARAFIDTLEKNNEIMEAYKLYQQVATLVSDAAAAIGFEQVPEYAPIKYAKHEAGEFFFVPKGAATKIAALK